MMINFRHDNAFMLCVLRSGALLMWDRPLQVSFLFGASRISQSSRLGCCVPETLPSQSQSRKGSKQQKKNVYFQTLLKTLTFHSKLYESRMAFVESSSKTGWLWLKALRKQNGFRWKLFENGMVWLKAQWKQDDFRWKLSENYCKLKVNVKV